MGHDHHHHNSQTNIGVAFFLNLVFTIIEFIGGYLTNSVAIISDALHDLGDALSLGMAWYFEKVAKKKRDHLYSYGYKRFSILGALVNAIILIVGSIFILSEAIPRLNNPEVANAKGMILLAILGVTVNGFAAWKLSHGHSHNEKVVSLHMLEDVLGWVAVLIGAIIMYYFNWPIIDPILSILIACFILYNVIKSLKSTTSIVLQGVPIGMQVEEIESGLLSFKAINSLHDMHIWTMDGNYNVLTVHLVLEENQSSQNLLMLKSKVKTYLKSMNIAHATIEFEAIDEDCGMEDC